ncbi:MAG: hypothetical protein ACERKO_00150 [Acetanaerobacterium sp.]
MKARLLPLFFEEANERERAEYKAQLETIKTLYGDEAELLEPVLVGSVPPDSADAVLFPQMFGAVFAHRKELEGITLPIILLTSRFGTVEMWDWEIVAYLREELRLNVFAPYNQELARIILRAVGAKSAMRAGLKFLMFQDSPGEGMQANIFKRFYWWEQECTLRIQDAFGVEIVYCGWKSVNERAQAISDARALALWTERSVPTEGVPQQNILKAVKLYIAVRETIDEIERADGKGCIQGVGANCLNESFHSETTPCLAWNWIYEYDHIIWACEGDTVTLISKFIIHSALRAPMMMTNIYPFLVGMAALAHEKISEFPKIDDPDNHALGVHCGYMGLVPQSFCTDWMMRPKVLEIVNDNAIVLDCRMKTGPVTMAKLHADMNKLTIIEAEIEDYAQYPGSDCRNGVILRYANHNGHRVMESLSSHHALIIAGDVTPMLLQLSRVYGFETEVV